MVLKSFWLTIVVAFSVTVLPLDSAQAQVISPEPSSPEQLEQIQQQKILLQSYGYQPWEWQKSNCSNCELYVQTLHPELQTEKVQLFIQALSLHKSELQMFYKIDGDEYNLLAHMAIGILGRESLFFTSYRYQMKETAPGLVRLAKILRYMFSNSNASLTDNSRGPTQIKIVPSLVARAYGIDPDHLYIADNAAIATMGFLIESLGELKRRVVKNKLDFVTPATYVDYLPYIYFGSTRALIKKTATPDTNLYVKDMKKYMKWVDLYEREQSSVPLKN
jgi:hypothetical protein